MLPQWLHVAHSPRRNCGFRCAVPPPRHKYFDQHSGLAEIYLRFVMSILILMTWSRYNAGADGLVIWGDAGGNPQALSCQCDPEHNGPTNPTYFENLENQTGPIIQEYKAKVAQCSAQHCNEHGRCDSVPNSVAASADDDAADQASPSCICFPGYSGPTCKSTRRQ
jgi:hypothetical protein|eukprot:SAG25_NODE_62_length_17948_cov_8.453975_16_plen_166_part_00